MTKRWLSPEEAADIGKRNREAWKQVTFVRPENVVRGPKLRGPTKARSVVGVCPTETEECLAFIAWTRLPLFRGEPLCERVIKIPNERSKSGVQAAILTSIGMRPGFPDYMITAPAGRWHGLYLEAKRIRGSKTDPEQLAWKSKLIRWGYHAEICLGADQMIDAVRRYFTAAGSLADGSWLDPTKRGPTV